MSGTDRNKAQKLAAEMVKDQYQHEQEWREKRTQEQKDAFDAIKEEFTELLAENERLSEKVKQLESDVAHHILGWGACVDENNQLRARAEELFGFTTAVSKACSYSGSDMDSRREDFIDISYRDDAIDLLASLPPQTTEGE